MLLRLADGVYTPLAGFMTAAEAAELAAAQTLDGVRWFPVPVILDVPPATAERLATGGPLVLREAEGPGGRGAARRRGVAGGRRLAGRRRHRRAAGAARLRSRRPAPLPDRGARRDRHARLGRGDRGAGRSRRSTAPTSRRSQQPRGGARRRPRRSWPPCRPRPWPIATATRGCARCAPPSPHLGPGRGLLVLDTRPEAEGPPGSAIDAVLARAFGCGTRRRLGRRVAPRWRRRAARTGVAIERLAPAPAAPADDERWRAGTRGRSPRSPPSSNRQAPPSWAARRHRVLHRPVRLRQVDDRQRAARPAARGRPPDGHAARRRSRCARTSRRSWASRASTGR